MASVNHDTLSSAAVIGETVTAAPEQTRDLGHRLGRLLTQPLVVRLSGDLGSGKTCFTQGLARGLDVPEAYDITSPTYALIHEYPGRMPFYHVDLYRLDGQFDATAIGLEDILYDDAVVVVEWPDRLPPDQWPSTILDIRFDLVSDSERRIRVTACGLGDNNLIRELFIFD